MGEEETMNQELNNADDIMEEVLFGKTLTPDERAEQKRRKAEYDRLANEKVKFRGVERKRGDFCSWADEPLGDTPLSYSGFTEEESRRAAELAKPFNDRYYDENDDNSMSMFARWMDKDGFIFAVQDDLTGSTMDTVHENDLAKFLADYKVNGNCVNPMTKTK